MNRTLCTIALALLLCLALPAATINTTMTGTLNVNLASTAGATGTATLTSIGSGTVSATLSLTPDAQGNLSAPFVITLTTGDKINGTLKFSASALAGQSSAGSATITGGTGAYANATGSFPSLTSTGSLAGTTAILNFSGSGTIVTGGAPPPPSTTPTITDVLDAGGYTKNVAQGSFFVIKGSNLGGTGFQAAALPFPDTFNGVTINFTPISGGSPIKAYVVYLFNQDGRNQLAALLPSTAAPGNYNVSVQNSNGTSAGFAVQVVQRKPGLITADSSGSGLALVNPYSATGVPGVNRLTSFACNGFTCSPAKPGQFIGAWATGLGPVSGADNAAQPVFDMSKNGVDVKAIVGGVSIPVAFAGRAPGGAGGDQINFQLPNDVTTGCTVPFQISVNGVLSNSTYIAIAPDAGSSTCVMPGLTASQLQNLDQNGGSLSVGSFNLSQLAFSASGQSFKTNNAGGSFTRFTNTQLGGYAAVQAQTSTNGACQVIHVTGTQSALASGGIGLDAGAVTLSGPTGSNINNLTFTQDPTTLGYNLNLGTEGISIPGQTNASIVAGTYTVRGAGGADVGAFNASVNLGSPLTLSAPLPASINRGTGLTLNWSGGNASDVVQIFGYSGTTSGTGTNATVDATEFICTTTAGARTFTVPASILSQLPPTPSGNNGTGFIEVSSGVFTNFTAPLKAGGNVDQSTFGSFLGSAATTLYQ